MRSGFEDGAAEQVRRQGARRGHGAERACARRELEPRRCGGSEPSQAEAGSALSYRRSAKTELVIQTQDGDVVRLKIRSRDALGVREEGGAEGEAFEVALRSSTRISFSVEGELDEGELAAIKRVMEQAGELAEDFFAGDLEAAFATAQALEIDPAELARVGLRIKLREELTYAQHGAPRSLPTVAPAPATPQPEVPVGPVPPELAASAAAPVESAPVVSEGETARPDSPFAAIADFLVRLRETFELAVRSPADAEPEAGSESNAAPVQGTLKLKIFQSVLLTLRAGQAQQGQTAELPGLVSRTLDALDAHVRPPVDEVA